MNVIEIDCIVAMLQSLEAQSVKTRLELERLMKAVEKTREVEV